MQTKGLREGSSTLDNLNVIAAIVVRISVYAKYKLQQQATVGANL